MTQEKQLQTFPAWFKTLMAPILVESNENIQLIQPPSGICHEALLMPEIPDDIQEMDLGSDEKILYILADELADYYDVSFDVMYEDLKSSSEDGLIHVDIYQNPDYILGGHCSTIRDPYENVKSFLPS